MPNPPSTRSAPGATPPLSVHVCLRREEIDPRRLAGKLAVVLDILFATTTIVTALGRGAREVRVAMDPDEARRVAADLPEGERLLAGELYADVPAGFHSPFPMAVAAAPLAGRTLVLSTTNGTGAIRESAPAHEVVIGSLLNARAVAEHAVRDASGRTVALVCSGSIGRFNLEDFYGAGAIVAAIAALAPGRVRLSDAARAALHFFEAVPARVAFHDSRVGRMMAEKGLHEDVAWAQRLDALPIVPRAVGDRITVPA